ncbi:hypothetical protein MCOR07_004826 [Pyricularia oryzae]|nr:hypothetical protein MCOR01_007823 [Pyricularia oryzae]KAI6316209.1 hypothetical protein MCOR29_006753 [Pyricularia oryzae]KAI6394346.1 hypothetical protein MCOR23_007573 [Pyricularia oryzae]KAI6398734.1 hypothetical protein MCOR20_009096 [Pyricularia oryzae]KAI6419977.1 hypothetical protein MCOR21_009999 [Pyricularia oryzae]
MPKLSDMPIEILCQISRQLSTTDLGNLRLTNKRYEAAIFKPFMREFFSKKQFMLTEPSLRALIDISLHPQFAYEIKHLILGLDHYQSGVAGFGPSEDQNMEYVMGSCAQRAFLNSGTARDMLAMAVKNLPSLEVIDIRDFRSNSRTRDRGAFSSYGAPTVERSTGLPLRMSSGPADYVQLYLPSIAFSIVLQVIGSRGIGIETVIRNNHWGLTDSAFSLSEFNRAPTVAALQCMKKLHLCLDMNNNEFTSHTAQDPKDVEARRWMAKSHLQTLLSYTTNLEWLRLNFLTGDLNLQRSFLCWVGLPTQYGSPVFAAPLKRLDLGYVRIRSEEYIGLFRKFKGTLEAFSIWNSSIEMSTQDVRDKVNQWGQLFKRLAVELPHLREVVVGRLRAELIYAVDIVANNGEKGGNSVEYRGDDARGFLKRLGERIVPQWPASDSESELDSEDSDGFVAGDDEENSDGETGSELE